MFNHHLKVCAGWKHIMNLININISLFNDNIHDESLDIQSC